jgi:SEC-C motif domain protein
MAPVTACPCGSGEQLDGCCGLLLDGVPAATALALMRSRYTAYVRGAIDYLIETHDPSARGSLDRAAITAWSRQSSPMALAPISSDDNVTRAIPPHHACLVSVPP